MWLRVLQIQSVSPNKNSMRTKKIEHTYNYRKKINKTKLQITLIFSQIGTTINFDKFAKLQQKKEEEQREHNILVSLS